MTTISPPPLTLLEQRRNLITNPVAGVDLTRWGVNVSSGAAPTLNRSLTVSISGISVGGTGPRVTTAAVLTGRFGTLFGGTSDLVPATEGETYTFSAYLRHDSTGGGTINTNLVILWRNAAGVLISADVGTPTVHTVATYQRRSVTAVAPAGAAGVTLEARVNGTSMPSGSVLTTSAYLFEAGALQPFFYGETTDAPPTYYGWAGTAHASDSIESLQASDITPVLVDGFYASRRVRTIAHRRANTSKVSVVFQPPEPRRGTLSLLFEDAIDAAAALAILSLQVLFTLTDTDVPEVDMIFAVADGELRAELHDETRREWVVSVPFVEVLP
jgi:hypothetical protein